MSTMFSASLEGDLVVEKALKELPVLVQRRIMKKGMVQIGSFFVIEFRKRAPVRSGKLKRGIKNRSGGSQLQFVKIFAPNWHLVEFGTDHRYTKSGAYRGRVLPKKFAFIRPTLYSETDNAIRLFEGRVRTEIEAEARKRL